MRRWLPRLQMDGGVMQELGSMRDVLSITRVPHGVESSIQARYCPCLRLHEASAQPLRFRQSPYRSHSGAIDQHDRCIVISKRQKTVLAEISIKQFSRIAKVHLINIVIDGFPETAGKIRNREPIIGEARKPPCSVESDQIFHEINLIDPARVADPFDRPEEDPLGAILRGFGPEKDTDRWFWTRGYNLTCA